MFYIFLPLPDTRALQPEAALGYHQLWKQIPAGEWEEKDMALFPWVLSVIRGELSPPICF